MKEFNKVYKVGDMDEIVDELGSQFIALRKLAWVPKDEECESPNYKLDIRKWRTNSDGEEVAGKGVSFLTDEGPHELIHVLVDNGYGDTEKILRSIMGRDDYNDACNRIMNGEETVSSDLFDPRDLFTKEN